MIQAIICTIGDEILIGQILDTNSTFIATQLNNIGIRVNSILSIGDNREEILSNLKSSIEKVDIVIITGGLGPTKDDITKGCLAEITNCQTFNYNKEQSEIIETICAKRGINILQINRDQALAPDSCDVIVNRRGTAPALVYERDNKLLFSLPGVPFEMKDLIPEVLDRIKQKYPLPHIAHRTINTFGLPESLLATMIAQWEADLDKNLKLAYLPNPSIGVRLRLSCYNGTKETSIPIIDKAFSDLSLILGDSIYGEEKDTLASIIYDFLNNTNQTISVVESCTGGNLALSFTKIAGASKIFKGGIISYSNDCKIDTVGVNRDIIEKYGAVSEECVLEMVRGVQKLLNSDYAIATSGIAGPSGGSPDKPVGTLWIAVIGPGFITSKKIESSGTRDLLIEKFSAEALNFMRLNMGIKLY